jgi:hypothetical protein
VSGPRFKILTQVPVMIDLSRPAMLRIIAQLEHTSDWAGTLQEQCEVDNFKNLLHNLLERSEPVNLATVEPENLDLIGG